MTKSVLYQTNTLNWIFIVLAHWNNIPWIDMSAHPHTLSWFRNNQFLVFLLNAACLTEKRQMPMIWRDRDSNPRSTALENRIVDVQKIYNDLQNPDKYNLSLHDNDLFLIKRCFIRNSNKFIFVKLSLFPKKIVEFKEFIQHRRYSINCFILFLYSVICHIFLTYMIWQINVYSSSNPVHGEMYSIQH
jgi:hypothetical protein